MRFFKFIISGDTWVPSKTRPNISYKGCVAVVRADTEIEAIRAATAYASENGFDASWLEVATVKVLEIDTPTAVLTWVQQ